MWLLRTGQAPLVWSRRGARLAGNTEARVAEGIWVAQWAKVFEAQSVIIAIPGRALLELVTDAEEARQFTGNIFSAAASLSLKSLQRVFPQATVTCISPFLINDVNSIPVLVLRPADLSPGPWEKAKAELENFGELDVVEDEETFAQVSLLGASWPAVILAAVQAAARAGVQNLSDETAVDLGRRIFFRGMQSLLTSRAGKSESSSEIATPGGITEQGLKGVEELESLFESIFARMRARADELRT